jgi:TolA-binding protein
MPVATAPNPAKHATGTASESENTAIQNNPPAAISMDTQNGTSATSGVTPLSSTPESASSTATVQTGKTVPVAVLHAMQAELVQMQGEIQTLSTAMGRMDSRTVIAERHLQQHLHQMDQKAHNPFARAAITTHSEIAGYRLQSIGETEAWLSNPDGKTVIASAGTHLPGLTILAVAPEGVKTSEGWLGF